MSVREATPYVPKPVSTRFLRSELMLIFGRRRNWAGMAALAAIPIIIAVVMKLWPGGGGGPDFFNQIANNGLFVSLAALTAELPLFLPLAVAAIAGDSVAGEANTGTLRYLLAVPVDRTRLLAVKYLGVVIFAFAAVALVAATGMLIGLLLFGGGDVLLLSGSMVGFGEGVLRVLGVVLYLGVCLSALGAIGVFVSTLTEQPIGATIAIMVLTVLSFILDQIEQLDWLQPYLLTHHWMDYGEFLRDPVDLGALVPGLLVAAAYTGVFLAGAWARFAGKDVSS
ncbi:ABC transporter permease [Virgisporangium aliadipatigenens]|uniref:ABC transporter permease n=1 Tax=Virgisporangium aliadipatigenens TaxID=741659 RepID=A0A8J4DS28_9ACTN|nr:ABC transporter permease [Virgisporangium aliadipatigenens]GIJ47726.1 ABC transporter permease [Virgisporangium aliadipatigenens]